MSFISRIEHLRSKPEHIRHRIALLSSAGITIVIAAFWVASYTTVGSQTRGAVADAVNNVGTPAQSMVASVGSAFGDIKDIFFKPKTVEYKAIEVLPGKK